MLLRHKENAIQTKILIQTRRRSEQLLELGNEFTALLRIRRHVGKQAAFATQLSNAKNKHRKTIREHRLVRSGLVFTTPHVVGKCLFIYTEHLNLFLSLKSVFLYFSDCLISPLHKMFQLVFFISVGLGYIAVWFLSTGNTHKTYVGFCYF